MYANNNGVPHSHIPPHLSQRPWLDFEEDAAREVADKVAIELKLLAKNPNAKRVHDTRVVLRQWDSIWKVLEKDGWRTERYWKKVGGKLQKLQKLLGELRDWDVNLETAKAIDLPHPLNIDWTLERSRRAKRVRSGLKKLDVKAITRKLRRFVRKRPQQLREELSRSAPRQLLSSAFTHLDPYLMEQEELARVLERHAAEPEALHQLRLSIKAWRYILTEFFGLTNIELVKAQQLLGKYNDVSRALALLKSDEESSTLAKDAIVKLEQQSEQLLKEFSELRKSLPFGLRPVMRSLNS